MQKPKVEPVKRYHIVAWGGRDAIDYESDNCDLKLLEGYHYISVTLQQSVSMDKLLKALAAHDHDR
jgi:hypothetical protein